MDGEPSTQELNGLAARVLQHEVDHLDSLAYLDRLESAEDLVSQKELARFLPP